MTNTLQTISLLSSGANYCDVSKITTARNNIVELITLLSNLGYDTSGITEFAAVTINTAINLIRNNFNNYDYRIYQLSNAVDYVTPDMLENRYYWAVTPVDIKEQLNRWFSWCNEQKEVIDGAETGTQPLCDINGELTRDTNNDIIYVEVE